MVVCMLCSNFLVIPCFFQRCSDTKVSDKTTFTTFARTLPPSSKVSKSVVALLVAFNWNKFVVVCGTDPASGSEVQEAIEVSFVIVIYLTSVT